MPVRNEKLRVGLIKLQQLEGELARTEGTSEKMEMYEKLLMECQDAMQIVREDLAAEVVCTCTVYTTSKCTDVCTIIIKSGHTCTHCTDSLNTAFSSCDV